MRKEGTQEIEEKRTKLGGGGKRIKMPHLASLNRKYTGNRSSQLPDIAARDLRKGKLSQLSSLNLEKDGGGLDAQRLAI